MLTSPREKASDSWALTSVACASLQGKWRAYYPPHHKKRTALLRKLKRIFQRYQSQPVDRVIQLINPILRGWVASFALGDASRCFGYVRGLGGKEDAAPSEAGRKLPGLRLAEGE